MLNILFWGAVGYVVCVVFPMPIVSRAILDTWAKVGAWFKTFGTTPAPIPVANTTTTVTK